MPRATLPGFLAGYAHTRSSDHDGIASSNFTLVVPDNGQGGENVDVVVD
jgi:hypothetical protein